MQYNPQKNGIALQRILLVMLSHRLIKDMKTETGAIKPEGFEDAIVDTVVEFIPKE